MAAFTSKATGNWSASGQTTWNEVGVPGNGDTVTIGAHTVTVDVDTIIGHSPGAADATAAILLNNASARVTVAAGITLTCRGDLKKAASGAGVTLSAGAKFKFDATQAGTPDTALYIAAPTGFSLNSPIFTANGTSGSRCEISSVAGGGYGRIAVDGFNRLMVEADYCDFIRLGDASNYGMQVALTFSNTFRCSDCTFQNTGGIDCPNGVSDDSHFTLQRCIFSGTTGPQSLDYTPSGAKTTGTRLVDACVFDKVVQFFSPRDTTITNNYFHEKFTVTDGNWTLFSGNLVRDSEAASMNIAGSVSDCFFLEDHTNNNPHFIQVLNYDRAMTVDGCVFEYTGTSAVGDCILLANPASARTATITGNIFLPNSAGEDSGTLFSCLGGANVTLVCEHNTCFAGSQGAAVGETYAGHTGMISSFKSNIIWDTSARGFKLYDSGSNDSVSDLVSAAAANYNCGHNLLAGSNLKGYDALEFSSGSPGANDVDVDPQFVDESRDLAKWDQSLGGVGTVAAALARLQADPTLTASSLIPYIQAGFAVTNPLLENAGHDGVTIGAMEYQAPSGGGRGMGSKYGHTLLRP